VLNRVIECVSNVEELGESEQLEDFVDLGLDFQEHQVTAAWFYCLQECRERSNSGGGDVVESPAMKYEPNESRFHRPVDAFLKEVRVVRVYVAVEIENETILNRVDPLKFDAETFSYRSRQTL
jgi:hypothetical protein